MNRLGYWVVVVVSGVAFWVLVFRMAYGGGR